MIKYFKFWTKYWYSYFFIRPAKSKTHRPTPSVIHLSKMSNIGLSAKEAIEALSVLYTQIKEVKIPYAIKPRRTNKK